MSSTYLTINGIEFDADVGFESYEQSVDVVDGSEAGRVMSGDMVRDVIGTYMNFNLTFFRRSDNRAGFDALWDYLYAHAKDDYVTLTAASGQSTVSQRVYYTSFKRQLEKVEDGVNYWNGIEVHFIALGPIDRR